MNDDPKDLAPSWEERLHHELRALPDHEAPPDLVSNVMALVRAKENVAAQAWYRQPYALWPRALQLAFGSGAIALFALLAWSAPALWAHLPDWPEPPAFVARSLAELSAFSSAVRALLEALSLAAATFLTPVRTAILVAIVASQLALLGVGGSLWRHLMLQRNRGLHEKLLPFQP